MTSSPGLPVAPFLLTDPALGIDLRTLRRHVARGEVRRVLRGVGVRADLDDTALLRAQAARLVLGPGQVVVDHSAAWLHGVDVGPIHGPTGPPVREVAHVHGGRATRRDGTDGCRRTLPPADVSDVHGVRVSSPLRTAADLACRRGRYDALAVLDAFARHHGLDASAHRPMTERFAGRRGVVQYRELVPLLDPRAESARESWTRLAVREHGFADLVPQVWTWVEGLGWVRLDLADPQRRIAVEYDGADVHGDEDQQEHDRERRRSMERQGWVFVLVRAGGFVEPGLSSWITQLRTAYDIRTAPRKRRYARGETTWSSTPRR